ncbi:hypothetical protein KC980_02025 [candidate division WWE3 bacterium]|uniref:Uncharacterized protein n=1 Tax=candidate division WWE3 bacterium TaxID=2053526 RepID=A0A955J1X4_UNCKA|nr:hypothetical protein [candidate division WWE3 bacterium]
MIKGESAYYSSLRQYEFNKKFLVVLFLAVLVAGIQRYNVVERFSSYFFSNEEDVQFSRLKQDLANTTLDTPAQLEILSNSLDSIKEEQLNIQKSLDVDILNELILPN